MTFVFIFLLTTHDSGIEVYQFLNAMKLDYAASSINSLKEKLHLKLEYYYGTQISTPFNFILCQSKRCLHGQLEINSATR